MHAVRKKAWSKLGYDVLSSSIIGATWTALACSLLLGAVYLNLQKKCGTMQAIGWLSLQLQLSSNTPGLLAVPPWLLDPFECMSALQKDEEDVQAVSSVPHAQYPWQLKCCSQNGETKLYHMPEQDSASLYFAGAATAATHLLCISP